MRYIIKNCDNCYCYDDEENIEDKYWCEFERDNTHFANPCYKSDCLLKQIVAKCKEHHNDLHFTASEVLSLLEIEECER
jgi:hypothetical protein